MAITTPPEITPYPEAPQRNQAESVFVPLANTFVASLEPRRVEMQALADWMKTAGDYIDTTITDNKTAIDTVHASIADVNTVADDIANVNTAAANIADVNTTATNIADVNKVAAIDGDVSTVAASDLAVNTVATDIANVNTAAGSIANVNAVAADIANVNTTATNIADVNAVAADILAVQAAAALSKRQALYSRSLALNPPLANETLRLDYANRAYGIGDKATGLIDDIQSFAGAQTLTRATPKLTFDATGTLVDVPANEPAYQYDPLTGEARALLIEGQRTNLLLWSDDFTQWLPVGTASLISSNSEIAPDGTQTADVIQCDGVNNYFRRRDSLSDSGQQLPQSIYVKPIAATYAQIRPVGIGGTTFDAGASNFDFGSESFTEIGGSTDAVYFEKLPNGWYRIEAVSTMNGTNLDIELRVSGDGQIAVWRGSAENIGARASSPIKTEGAQVTRAADNCSRTLGAEFNPGEGTLYWEGIPSASSVNSQVVFGVSDGTNNNRTLIRVVGSSGSAQCISVRGGVVSSDVFPGAFSAGELTKIALSYDQSGWKYSVNGVARPTKTEVTGDVVATTAHLSNGPGSNQYTGITGRAVYEPRAKTQSELEAMTAL